MAKKKVLPNATGTTVPNVPQLDLTYNPNLETPQVQPFTPIEKDTRPLGKSGQPIGQKVKFNQDGTVDLNGKTLSKNEYNAYLQSQGGGEGKQRGALTPQVQQLATEQQQREMGTTQLNPLQLEAQRQSLAVGDLGNTSQRDLGETGVQLGTNAVSIVGGATAGAGAGALIGGAAGLGVGAIPGAILGGIVGGAGALFGKLSLDERQKTKEAYKNYTNAKNYLTKAEALANEGRTAEAQQLFRDAKRNMLISQAQLKEKTKTAYGRQLSNAMDEYSTVNDYINLYLPAQEVSFLIALNNPNPTKAMQLNNYLASQPQDE